MWQRSKVRGVGPGLHLKDTNSSKQCHGTTPPQSILLYYATNLICLCRHIGPTSPPIGPPSAHSHYYSFPMTKAMPSLPKGDGTPPPSLSLLLYYIICFFFLFSLLKQKKSIQKIKKDEGRIIGGGGGQSGGMLIPSPKVL